MNRIAIPLALALLCIALFHQRLVAQESISVAGQIVDSVTGSPLGFATVRVEGTTKGAIANSNGRFVLRLSPGSYMLSFSMVGYRKERTDITVGIDSLYVEMRMGRAVSTKAPVVVYSVDPGVRMMRRAIARKVRQSDSLESYNYTLYTKFSASTDTTTAGRASGRDDTTIVSIFESYSRGYYRRPDSYYNEIIQRRQTANIPPEANFVAFGTNLNAYDDYITILGEEIATPFHRTALDYYDFVLESTSRVDDSLRVHRIRVTPKSDGRKLFSGFIELDSVRSIPLYVELQPNRAVGLPFDAALTYRQTFDEVDGRFVMPTGMQIYSSLQASLFWIIAPRLDINIETVAYDYRSNIPLDDDLFSQRRVEANQSADMFDSAYWAANPVMPLRPEEIVAYDQIRTAQENPDSLEGTGWFGRFLGDIPRTIGRLNRKPFTGIEDIFRYNRVHGAYLGAGITGEIAPWLEGTIKAGYGSADSRWYGELSGRAFLDESHRFSIAASGYRRLVRRDNPYIVTTSAITAVSILNKNDYGDYYYGNGFDIGVEAGFGQLRFLRRDQFVRPTTIRLFYRNEDQTTAATRASFAVFGGDREFRENPPIFDGTLRSVGLEFNYNYTPQRKISDFGFQLAGEFSSPSILSSTFSFEQYYGALLLRTRTLPLWKLDVRLSGGFSRGDLPPQRFFSLESAVSSIAGDAVFRGMEVKEFYGDRYAALSLEHNFGEVIPGVLRIPNIASFGIEFILLGRVGWSAFSEKTLAYTRTTLPTTAMTSDRYYYEVGLGLNRILFFFRVDLFARLSQREKPEFGFTISGATF